MQERDYTCKVVYHFTGKGENDTVEKIKQVQLFENEDSATQWASIQQVRGFTPVSVENDTAIDVDMYHVGDLAPQVHTGHYSQKKDVWGHLKR